MGAQRCQEIRKEIKSWDVVDRMHANRKTYYRPWPWWKPWQVENDTRPRKDKRLHRRARRRVKNMLRKCYV